MPSSVEPEHGPLLRQAAFEHSCALRPARPDQINRSLMAMRSSTHLTVQSEKEHEASFRALAHSMADVPLDILNEAIRTYVRQEAFFPRAPAELIRFTAPLLARRRARARNLLLMAREAEEKARRDKAAKDQGPVSIDELRELVGCYAVSPTILDTYLARGWARPEDVEIVRAERAQQDATLSCEPNTPEGPKGPQPPEKGKP
jgi:hypothetical protein